MGQRRHTLRELESVILGNVCLYESVKEQGMTEPLYKDLYTGPVHDAPDELLDRKVWYMYVSTLESYKGLISINLESGCG